MPRYVISTGDRVAIVGMTGSGKTVFANHLTRGIERLVVLDGKGELWDDPSWNLEDWSERGRRELLRGRPVRLRVPPPPPDAESIYTWWNSYLLDAYSARNCTVYVDEMYTLGRPGAPPGSEVTAILTRGRSLAVGFYGATQRPAWVPRFFFSEATWLAMFRLQDLEDRRSMAQLGFGPAAMNPIPDPYGYLLKNAIWPQPVYSSGLVLDRRDQQAIATRKEPERLERGA